VGLSFLIAQEWQEGIVQQETHHSSYFMVMGYVSTGGVTIPNRPAMAIGLCDAGGGLTIPDCCSGGWARPRGLAIPDRSGMARGLGDAGGGLTILIVREWGGAWVTQGGACCS
jgi:hypothetical protein